MTEHTIKADIYATWIKEPSYRLWFDGELMCERTFWPNPQRFVIQENFTVDIESGIHELRLEQIDQTLGKVWMRHIKIIDLEHDSASEHTVDNTENNKNQILSFTINTPGDRS